MGVVQHQPKLLDRTRAATRTRRYSIRAEQAYVQWVKRRALKAALKPANISKNASSHSLRPSFAKHLLTSGYDIRTIQELIGHKSVETPMICTHVLNKDGKGVTSPIDELTSIVVIGHKHAQ